MQYAVGTAPLDPVYARHRQYQWKQHRIDLRDRAPGDDRQPASEAVMYRQQGIVQSGRDDHRIGRGRQIDQRAIEIEEKSMTWPIQVLQ